MTLQANDLKDMIYPVFEVDAYKSKMGSDAEIVVVSFSVNEKAIGEDLVNFIEKGYGFVLDADVTAGEQSDGMYRVYVEMERNSDVPDQIVEMLDGVSKLAGTNFRYRYYKSFQSEPATLESLAATIPVDNEAYEATVNEANMNNFKNFFNKSYLEECDLDEYEDLILKKAYADPIGFAIKDFGPSQQVQKSINEKVNMNDYAEILFLTKYIGDYNIMKYGSKTLTFENEGHTLVVERL